MGRNIFEGNPVFSATGKTQPRKVGDVDRKSRAVEVELVINGGKVKAQLLELESIIAQEIAKSTAKFETDDIEHLSNAELDALKCGDFVIKRTGNMKHCYVVTYKEEGKGICISYYAYKYLETISYDCVEGEWSFNDKEIWDGSSNVAPAAPAA